MKKQVAVDVVMKAAECAVAQPVVIQRLLPPK
jgi:hypothetical protein